MKKFLRGVKYSLYPHELGLCGPQGCGKGKLYEYLTTDEVRDEEMKEMLEQFAALCPYLKLIAKSNKIDDWSDPRVFDAYWIGNDLLDNVRPEDLANIVRGFADKGRLTANTAEEIAARVHEKHRPHHSFHVFVVGSISGKVERGSIGQELCRIGWGEVRSIEDQRLEIFSRTLVRDKNKYLPKLGEEELLEIKYDPLIISNVKVGDIVTCHWGNVVEIVSEETAERLEYWTERTLKYC
jgi:hypothetical protein